MEKVLGKIQSAYFGIGGYQDAMIGLHLSFSMQSSGIGTTISAWDSERIKWSEHCKWSESDRDKNYSEIVRKVSLYLSQAKVDRVEKLKNVPVEITIDGNSLKDWRILTEVI